MGVDENAGSVAAGNKYSSRFSATFWRVHEVMVSGGEMRPHGVAPSSVHSYTFTHHSNERRAYEIGVTK